MMLYRNIWKAVDSVQNCKGPLLQQNTQLRFRDVRSSLRNSFHSLRRGARKPKLEPEPLEALIVDTTVPLDAKSLFRPFTFAVGVSTVSLAGCAIWEYETLRIHASSLFRKPGKWLNAQQKKFSVHAKGERNSLLKWWSSLRDSEKVFYPILAANVLVFGAWRVKAWHPFMVKYFCSNPSSKTLCLPMLLSTFSQYSFMHLAANMYVLYSFMPAAIAALGKEQFVAMYLSGGVISSFGSFMYKVLLNQPGLSLGASGAIMSVLAYVCVQYPDTKLSIIFLPMYTFAAGTAIKVIMSIDLIGVLAGWKFFDHAAHLAGALFGIGWCYWGSSQVWGNRDKLLQYYHTLRRNDGR